MHTYTVIALADGQRIGGQSAATLDDVANLIHDEYGTAASLFRQLHELEETGKLMTVDKYKVFPSDMGETVSVLVVYKN